MDLNKVMIIGHVTRDPESRTTTTGQVVVNFSVATNFGWTDQTGQRKEQVEFHNIVAWRKLAEICQQYLRKGSKIYIEGRLQTWSWDDAATGQKRYRTEITVENMIMLDRPGAGSNLPRPMAQPTDPAAPMATEGNEPTIPVITVDEEINVEDIPF